MKTKTKFILFIVLIIVVVTIFGFLTGSKTEKAGQYDGFAQCIKNSGAEFYGTFWCSHCKKQKEEFGSSKDYLPYIECSTEDGKEQLQICKDKGVEGYPTWIFADGTRLSGELSFETLADKTGCQLPE